jgi:hypothetical protein
LYLRSFIDDPVTAKPIYHPTYFFRNNDLILSKLTGYSFDFGNYILSRINLSFSIDTQEEILAKNLDRIGFCIAVGQPDERLPHLGMNRIYFTDDKWVQGVQELMKDAELIFMHAGVTPNFIKELNMVAGNVKPDKLLIYLPDKSKKQSANFYTLFAEEWKKIFSSPLPVATSELIKPLNLPAIISFDENWLPTYTKVFDSGNTFQEAVENIALRYAQYGKISFNY